MLITLLINDVKRIIFEPMKRNIERIRELMADGKNAKAIFETMQAEGYKCTHPSVAAQVCQEKKKQGLLVPVG